MQNTVELPESIFRRTEEVARARGVGMDELISEMLERELAEEAHSAPAPHRVSLPIIHSKNLRGRSA
jgi:hypothetical protein